MQTIDGLMLYHYVFADALHGIIDVRVLNAHKVHLSKCTPANNGYKLELVPRLLRERAPPINELSCIVLIVALLITHHITV